MADREASKRIGISRHRDLATQCVAIPTARHAPMTLRIRENLVEHIDRAARHLRGFQRIDPSPRGSHAGRQLRQSVPSGLNTRAGLVAITRHSSHSGFPATLQNLRN